MTLPLAELNTTTFLQNTGEAHGLGQCAGQKRYTLTKSHYLNKGFLFGFPNKNLLVALYQNKLSTIDEESSPDKSTLNYRKLVIC